MDFKNKIIIIPDTNYFANDEKKDIILNQLNIDSYYKFNKTLEINDLKNQISMIIPELVLYELISHHKKSLKINEDINSEDYFKKLRDKYLNNEKNIIKIHSNKEKLFKTIFKRSLDKTPPFAKDSDKGFKDTILFLSLLEFCKNNAFKKCILVSNDSGIVDKKQYLQQEFNEQCNINEGLEVMYKKDFNFWLNDEYELFIDLKEYLKNEFYPQILEKYDWAYNISWGNGDTIIENYSLKEQDTEMYQFDVNKYEVIIFISIEINRSLDAVIGEFYEKNDEYYITQCETYFIEHKKRKWNPQLINSRYDVFFNEPDLEDFYEHQTKYGKH